MRALSVWCLAGCFAGAALARLPAPTPEEAARAAEKAARVAYDDKVGAYQLCLATTRTADYYRRTLAGTGKEAPAPVETPPCADPGPFVAQAPDATGSKPLESSGAHSPAETAAGPPSHDVTHAEQQSGLKK